MTRDDSPGQGMLCRILSGFPTFSCKSQGWPTFVGQPWAALHNAFGVDGGRMQSPYEAHTWLRPKAAPGPLWLDFPEIPSEGERPVAIVRATKIENRRTP